MQIILALAAVTVISGITSLLFAPLGPLLAPLMVLPYLLLVYPNYGRAFDSFWLFFALSFLVTGVLSLVGSEQVGIREAAFLIMVSLPIFYLAFPARLNWQFYFAFSSVGLLFIFVWVLGFSLLNQGSGAFKVESAAGAGNLYGAQVNMLWPIAILVASTTRNRLFQAIAIGSAILGVGSLFFIGSRSALAVCLALFALFLVRSRNPATYAAMAVGIAMVIFLASEVIMGYLAFYRLVDFSAAVPRPLIWLESWKALADSGNWFTGIGIGGSAAALHHLDPSQAHGVSHAHNNVMQALLEMGLLGGSLVLFFQLYILVMATKMLQRGGEFTYVGASLVAYFAYSLTSSPLWRGEMTFLLALVFFIGSNLSAGKGADASSLIDKRA